MKIAALCLNIAIGLASADAAAQGTGDAMEALRACARLAQAERLDCLDKLSRDVAPPRSVPAAAETWIVSETTSPLDYTPVAVATASFGAVLLVSIQCRGGRTDLVIGGSAMTRRVEDYVVSYVVDVGPPVMLAIGPPASGSGVAVKGDVVRLLASLPDRGEVFFRIAARQGEALEGRYALGGLRVVLDRPAVPCRWPAGASRNR